MSQDISAQEAEAQKLEDLTGMGVPKEELLNDTTETEVETKHKIEPAQKLEESPKAEDKKVEVKTEEKVEDKQSVSRSERPATDSRATKAIFAQINELRNIVKDIAQSQTKKETVEVVDEIAKLAEKRQLDPEELKDIIALANKKMMEDLEKSGKLNKDLPDEIKQKLDLLEQITADKKAQEEIVYFEKEWTSLLGELEKQYPNAKATEKNEAKKLMDDLAHTKEFKDKDLEYVWWKNRSKFDVLLKIAKGSKSGEESSKQIQERSDDEEDIDLDPEDMTPEKMKAYEKKKYSGQSEKLEMIG